MKLRQSKVQEGESPYQYVERLRGYLLRWIEMAGVRENFEGLSHLILKEQLINTCDSELATYLKEQAGCELEGLCQHAERFLEAHGKTLAGKSTKGSTPKGKPQFNQKLNKYCDYCKMNNHSTSECGRKARADLRKCYRCGDSSHYAKDCKKFQKGASALDVESNSENQCTKCVKCDSCEKDIVSCCVQAIPRKCSSFEGSTLKLACGSKIPLISGACEKHFISNTAAGCQKIPVVQGKVGNTLVQTLRDSGCSGVVVKKSLVKPEQFTGKSHICILIDGTVKKVPIAQIDINTPYLTANVEAMCMEKPVYDLIIGNVENARKPDDPDPTWSSDDKDIGCVLTRAQVKLEKKLSMPLKVPNNPDLDVNVENLMVMQSEDPTLAKLWNKKETVKGNNRHWFEKKNGLLYRYFQSPKVNTGNTIKQLVVPKQLRNQVMSLAHETMMGGHMGVKKTTDKILSNFYWPGIQADVDRFCHSCDICQKCIQKGRITKVPLEHMPIIDVPFKRVAVDLIGPLHPISSKGNRYILSIVDYATRYPEAIPLKNIDTVTIAEALIEVFSRLGVPEEILSDQGSQFMSDLMKEVSRLLSFKQINSSVYHPICNGLVERFNGTVKQLIKKLCAECPTEWDRYLPALLFAYREVPQETTGFAPFELLYGRSVRGPMQILRELWTKEQSAPEIKNTYQYIFELRSRLEDTCKMVENEVMQSRSKYKHYYDKKAKSRKFKQGDQVLVLLPTNQNKLLMQWRGPYKVEAVMGQNDYKINIKGKLKVYHANLLKKYVTRNDKVVKSTNDSILQVSCAAILEAIEETDGTVDDENLLEIGSLGGKQTYKDVIINTVLSSEQKQQINVLLEQFQDIFTENPGLTQLVEHKVQLTSKEPIRTKNYPIPYMMRDVIDEEITKMLDLGIIEKSESPYSSPVVIVRKRDGTNRFCIDFRKINRITVFDSEPMTPADDIMAKLAKDTIFSKIDFSKGYWQIPMSEESKPITGFTSYQNSFVFRRMPFGMKNSAATFNRMMHKLLLGLKNVDSYIDDVLVHTNTLEDHLETLHLLFQRVRAANLTIKPSKCEIGFSKIEFVGEP